MGGMCPISLSFVIEMFYPPMGWRSSSLTYMACPAWLLLFCALTVDCYPNAPPSPGVFLSPPPSPGVFLSPPPSPRDDEYLLGFHRSPPSQLPREARKEEVTTVINVSDNQDQLPDAAGEYTAALITKSGMPPDFTICGAFMIKAWTGPHHGGYFYTLKGANAAATRWADFMVVPTATQLQYHVLLGKASFINLQDIRF
jgi:hypothetical protein